MKLFSEKVEPTFTSSNLNILGVKNFKEVFIDVFEFEINGKKFIAEKVSEHNGLPVVNIPIVLEGNEYTAPFVLRRGQVEILFNKENAVFVKPVLEEVQELIEQYTDEEQVKVQTLIKSSIDELSNKLTASIEDRAANIESLVNEKIINLTTNTIPNVFLKGVNNVDGIINTEEVNSKIEAINETVKAEKNKIYADIETIASEATQLSEKIDKNTNRALSRIGNVKVQLEATITDVINSLEDKLKGIESKISDYYTSKIAEINESVRDITENNKEHIIDLINESKQTLLEEISKIKSDIPDIVIENEDGKKGVNVSGIKAELEKIIGTKFTTEIGALKRLIEMSSGGGSVAKQFANGGTMDGTLNVTGKYLSGGIDIATLFSGGGGGGGDDVAVSTLVRSSSANWDKGYLSYNNLTTLSGNWQSTYTTVNSNSADWSKGYEGYSSLTELSSNWEDTYTTVNSNSGNWDNAYNTGTVYQVNSGTYATIDFVDSKFFPLSGGVITGETRFDSNVTIFGNLTTLGTTSFANTVFSVTSALSVVHVGGGPAVWVGNNGSGDIASFYDIDQDIEILHVGGINSTYPNVGVKTSTPNKTFTVVGEISSTSDFTTSGKIYIQGDGGSDQWHSSYTTVQTNSASWDYQGTDLKNLSGNWENTYTTVQGNSALWKDLPKLDWWEALVEPLSQNVVALQIEASGDVVEGDPIPYDIDITLIANTPFLAPFTFTLSLTAGTIFNSSTIANSLALGLNNLTEPDFYYQVRSYNNFVSISYGADNFDSLTGYTLTCNYGTASAPAYRGTDGVIQYCNYIPAGLGQFIIESYYGNRQWICASVAPIVWVELINTKVINTYGNTVGINVVSEPTATLEVNGTTAIQDDATLYGTENTMPNQTLDAGFDSIITQDLMLRSQINYGWKQLPFTSTAESASTALMTQTNYYLALTLIMATNSLAGYAHYGIWSNVAFYYPNGSGAAQWFNQQFTMYFDYDTNVSTADMDTWWIQGRAAAFTAPGGSEDCLAFVHRQNGTNADTLEVLIYDGSGTPTTSGQIAATFSDKQRFCVVWDGATLSLYMANFNGNGSSTFNINAPSTFTLVGSATNNTLATKRMDHRDGYFLQILNSNWTGSQTNTQFDAPTIIRRAVHPI